MNDGTTGRKLDLLAGVKDVEGLTQRLALVPSDGSDRPNCWRVVRSTVGHQLI